MLMSLDKPKDVVQHPLMYDTYARYEQCVDGKRKEALEHITKGLFLFTEMYEQGSLYSFSYLDIVAYFERKVQHGMLKEKEWKERKAQWEEQRKQV